MTDHPSALVSVPVEPTEAMKIAGVHAIDNVQPNDVSMWATACWSAMLAAAPAAPQAAGVGEREAIARILDPKGWETRDRQYDAIKRSTMHDKDRPLAFANADYYTRDSLTKADAVIALRAPSREPEGGAAKLHLKLLDTLKPFAEVAEKLKHCHVVEICEPTPDNPSRNIIPMPREWFERAADDLEVIAIQLHADGALSEGQASKLTGLDRVEVRKLADALATSEEAPADAGEDDGDLPWPNTARANALHKHFSDLHGLDNEEASEEVYGVLDVINALRAQPPAREDAQPVDAAWHYTKDCPAPDALRVVAEAQPVGEIVLSNKFGSGVSWLDGKLPPLGSKLYTHPNLDTLRIAEEALEAAKTIEPLCMELADCMDEERDALVSELQQAHGKIADALADLQAEQGAK